MAPCGDGKLLFCILFLSCCIATLAQRPMDCCTDVSRTTIDRRSVADYRRQVKGQHGCAIDAVILVSRHGKKLCVATDLPWLSVVMQHVDDLKKGCKENNKYRQSRHCFGVKTENDPEPTAFHSPAMTTPPTLTTLAEVVMDCCTDVSRTTIERRSVTDYRRQVKGQGCAIDAVIFVTRRGKKLCLATDSPWLSDVMRHVDNLKKGCKEGRYKSRRCFGVNSM